MGRCRHIDQYGCALYKLIYAEIAASENGLPPKRFFAWGREANYKTRYHMHENRLYRSSGALSNSIGVLCFAQEDIRKQKTEYGINNMGYRLFHF